MAVLKGTSMMPDWVGRDYMTKCGKKGPCSRLRDQYALVTKTADGSELRLGNRVYSPGPEPVSTTGTASVDDVAKSFGDKVVIKEVDWT